MMRAAWMVLGLLLLSACGGEKFQDLQEFMRDAERDAPRKIDALPEVKAYTPFEYAGFDLPDPFRPRKLAPSRADGSGLQPDLNRRKEPLEAYPLESLKMVGTLQQGKVVYALIKAENTVYRVRAGNYVGQNFGLITGIGDIDVKLKEIVQDTAGDWTERLSSLQLIDEAERK
jgi:type IV pilus assembly protein PilP